MSDNHVPNRHPDDAPLATVPPTYPPQFSPYTPLRRAPSLDFHPTSYNTNSSPPPMADQENVPTPGTSDRKRKPDGYQLDASPKRLRQDISSGSPRSPLATQSQSRSNANHQHNHVEFPATPESTPEQTRKTPQSAELAPFKSMQDLRDTGLYVQEPDSSAPNSKYIAVAFGRIPGIYRNRRTASHQYNIRDGLHASFSTEDEALDFMNTYRSKVEESLQRHNEDKQKIKKDRTEAEAQMAKRTPSSSLSHTFSLPTPPSTQGSAYYDSSPGNNSVSGPGVQLSDEQKRVVKRIVDGENVFFTGSAGCGKSTVLKNVVPLLKAQGKVVQTIAPTNLAALAVGGRTLHSYAGWRPVNLSFTLDKLKADAHGTQQWKKFVEIDVLVIDEISMVPNLELERLNEVMKEARSALDPANRNRAFGGVQIVVTGDFCQLAPVKPFEFCIECGETLKTKSGEFTCTNTKCDCKSWPLKDKWAFRSKAWQECKFAHINLTKIFRQSDPGFVRILQKIRRDGAIPQGCRNILLNHHSKAEGGVKIYSLRKDVYFENQREIDKLDTPAFTYRCSDHFVRGSSEDDGTKELGTTVLYIQTDEYQEIKRLTAELKAKNSNAGKGKEHPGEQAEEQADELADFRILSKLEKHRYDAIVRLKEGMRVILQANIDPDGGLVNGSQGAIVGFVDFDADRLPRLGGDNARYAERQIRNYAEGNHRQPWPVVQFDNGRTKIIYADCACNEIGAVGEHGKDGIPSLISRTQIPLVAGYAITVHKSQGMTLDKVIVNLKDVFEASQIYVALSRARSLEGLKVESLPPEDKVFTADPQVKEFFDKYLDPSSPFSASMRPDALSLQSSAALPSSQIPQSSQASRALPSTRMLQSSPPSISTQQSPLAHKSYQMPPPSQEPPSSQLSDSFDVDEWDSLDVGEWL